MKKVISIFLTVVVLFLIPIHKVDAVGTDAVDNAAASTIQYFEDGSYIVTTLSQSVSPRASTYIRHGYKTVTHYNSSDEVEWKYTLEGTFKVVSGVSATCIDSTYTYEIVNDSWHLTDHSNWYSDNIAYGTATFKKKVLFIVTSTRDINASIRCDKDGNLS